MEIALGNETTPAANATNQFRDFRKRSGKAGSLITFLCSESIKNFIAGLPQKDPASIWTALAERYSNTNNVAERQATVRRFQNTEMKPGESIAD